jgi:transposase InsO family protein
MYLVAVMDWYSRYVLSWRLSNSMDADFCVEALEEALSQTTPEIMNTDMGSQFTSRQYTGTLTKHSVSISMDGKGRAIDNVMIERLWRTLKYEEIYLKEYTTVTDLQKGLSSYFNYYNSSSDCTFVLEVGKIEVLLFRVWSRGASATVPAGLIAYDTGLVGIEVAAAQNPGTIRQRMAGRYLSCFNCDPQGLGTDT